MKAQCARAAILLYAILLAATLFLTAAAGDYWPICIILTVLGCIISLADNNKLRIVGITLTLAAILLAIHDYREGKRLKTYIRHMEQQLQRQQQQP